MKLLTPELRASLKEPMGELLSKPDWNDNYITVGDECTYLASRSEKPPLLAIYDNRIKRHETCNEKKEAIKAMPGKKIVADNHAGTITDEALLAIRLGLENPPAKIEIRGEEDLLVLPCIAYAPIGTSVYYGQPNKGIVKVLVNKDSKKKANEIMLSMEVKE